MEKKKNHVVSCIYRTLGSKIDIFKNWMEAHCTTIKRKVMFVSGDFNIDLFKTNETKMTEECINTLYSIGLYPRIPRLDRCYVFSFPPFHIRTHTCISVHTWKTVGNSDCVCHGISFAHSQFTLCMIWIAMKLDIFCMFQVMCIWLHKSFGFRLSAVRSLF